MKDLRHQDDRQNRSEQGVALLVAMFMVVLMTGIVIEIQDMIRGDIITTAAFQDRIQARQNAESGIDAGRMLLLYDYEEDKRKRSEIDYYFNAAGLADLLDVRELWSFFAPANKEQLAEIGFDTSVFPLETGAFALNIEDLNARVNVHRLYRPRGLPDDSSDYTNFVHFLEMTGLEEQQARIVADSIIDWIDEDDSPREYGVESEGYDSLEDPYDARNGPMMVLDELRAIHGIDDITYAKLIAYLNVFPGDLKLYSEYKININTAPAEVLTFIHKEIGLTEAEAIIAERVNGPYRKKQDLHQVIVTQLGMNNEVWKDIFLNTMWDVRSDTFRMVSAGLAGRSEVVVEEVVQRINKGKYKVLYRASY